MKYLAILFGLLTCVAALLFNIGIFIGLLFLSIALVIFWAVQGIDVEGQI